METATMNALRTAVTCVAFVLLTTPSFAQGGEEVVYFHSDAVGSVRLVTDANGQVLERYDYLPFGEPYPPSAPVVETRRFGGKERDAESGLDYFGARHYSSLNGRFTTVDPVLQIELALTNPQRWDRYAYAGNNPLRFIDPDGADFWDFVNGVSDAMRANFAFGIGRSTGGNSDFVIGQRVGDVISLAGSAIETVGGFGTMSGGVAACGTESAVWPELQRSPEERY
jgi:RHS repeat-associated protein